MDTDVLVVGAGPVGVTAAIVLTQNGRDVTVVDAQAEGANTSRAAVLHAHTLELLKAYGVVESLVERGVHAPRFTIRDRDRVLVAVPFQDLPTPYPYTLMISQADTEAVLLARLEQLGGTVLRPTKATNIDQDPGSVTATFENGTRIRAAYLIGADGMHSTVRDQIGTAFRGEAYAESFMLADVVLSGGLDDEVILYFSPAGLVVVAPLPDGMHRLVATVEQAPEVPSVAFVQRLLDSRGSVAEPVLVNEVVWGSRFRVHHRLADSFRQGRVMLAGDAAHVHSPAGGQGMNLGIEDAVHLGEMLSRVLDGAGSPELVNGYDAARRQVAQEVITLASRLTSLATADTRRRRLRNLALGAAGKLPAVQRQLARRLSGLNRR